MYGSKNSHLTSASFFTVRPASALFLGLWRCKASQPQLHSGLPPQPRLPSGKTPDWSGWAGSKVQGPQGLKYHTQNYLLLQEMLWSRLLDLCAEPQQTFQPGLHPAPTPLGLSGVWGKQDSPTALTYWIAVHGSTFPAHLRVWAPMGRPDLLSYISRNSSPCFWKKEHRNSRWSQSGCRKALGSSLTQFPRRKTVIKLPGLLKGSESDKVPVSARMEVTRARWTCHSPPLGQLYCFVKCFAFFCPRLVPGK